jgi:hypothetical protein
MAERELITLKQARERLGISKVTMTKLVRERGLTLYENPLDARQKLVDAAEIEALKQPRPVAPVAEKGAR